MSLKMRRILMSVFGVLITGACVGLLKLAAFGVDPFQTLMSGLHTMFPISFGTLYVIVNVVLLSFSLIFDRTKIGLATFINLFLLGYVTEFTYATLQVIFPDPSMLVRIANLVVGIVVLCFGASMYMTANMGVSTYDAVAIVLSEKWKVARFQYCRIATDVVCVTSGTVIYLLAGGSWSEVTAMVGVGTIVTAFFMGPIIAFFNEKVSKPMLGEK